MTSCRVIPALRNAQDRLIHRDGKQTSGCRGEGSGDGERLLRDSSPGVTRMFRN